MQQIPPLMFHQKRIVKVMQRPPQKGLFEKKLVLVLFVAGLGVLAYSFWGSLVVLEGKKKHTVAVSQFIDHVALNQVYQGVRDGVEQEGFKIDEDVEWIYENAQGNVALTTQIAKKFTSLRPSVMVALATPSAQALVALKTDIPLVFAAITDPVEAKLVKSLQIPGGSVTGVMDAPPVEKNIQLIRALLPRARRLGILYNAAEPNSGVILHQIQKAAESYGFELFLSSAPKTSEVMASVQQLVDKVDVFLFPLDNTITAVASGVVKLASTHKKPVFAMDPSLVKEGVLGAVGVSEYQGGVQAGKIVARLLKGDKPGAIAVVNSQTQNLALNSEKAKELGIELPVDREGFEKSLENKKSGESS